MTRSLARIVFAVGLAGCGRLAYDPLAGVDAGAVDAPPSNDAPSDGTAIDDRSSLDAPAIDAGACVPETCNGADDDCNGLVDDGLQTTLVRAVAMSELMAQQPLCSGADGRIDLCLTAAHRWCHDRPAGCYGGGVGFLTATATEADVLCFGSESPSMFPVAFADVGTAAGTAITSANVFTREAQRAVHRYCVSLGFTAGIGPNEHVDADQVMTIVCVSAPRVSPQSVGASALLPLGCDVASAASIESASCGYASHAWCVANGHLAGYGPVEWSPTEATVLCFDDA